MNSEVQGKSDAKFASGTPSTFGKRNRGNRKKNNTVDLCLYGPHRRYVLGENKNLVDETEKKEIDTTTSTDGTENEVNDTATESEPKLVLDDEEEIDILNPSRTISENEKDEIISKYIGGKQPNGYFFEKNNTVDESYNRLGEPSYQKTTDELMKEIGSTTSDRRLNLNPTNKNNPHEKMKPTLSPLPSFSEAGESDSEGRPNGTRSILDEDKSQKSHLIDLQNLRRIASQGIPDKGSHRPVVWRALLEYLPSELNQWHESTSNDRALYRKLICELFAPISTPFSECKGMETGDDDSATTAEENDNPSNSRRKSITINKPCINPDRAELDRLRQVSFERENSKRNCPNQSASQSSLTNDVEEENQATSDHPQDVKKSSISNSLKQSGGVSGTSVESDGGPSNSTVESDKSEKSEYEENVALLDEIRKDVVRTHPDLQFFLEPENNLGHRRYAALERILFVWAKLNRGVRYVQGMNEIVGTIYFVLATDYNEEWAAEAEPDTYFLFNTLMVEMRDLFVASLDHADTGIQGRISNFVDLLSVHDPEVRCHLEDIGIDPSFFGVRWLTTLLSREFSLPDTIRLWDSMFASTHKDNFLRYVCVTMVMVIRYELLKGDFSHCLRLLQSFPSTNIDRLLESSRALWIYESQVTLACHKAGINLSQALMTIAPPPAIIMAYGLEGGVASKSLATISPSSNNPNRRLKNIGTLKMNRSNGIGNNYGSSQQGYGSSSSSTSSIFSGVGRSVMSFFSMDDTNAMSSTQQQQEQQRKASSHHGRVTDINFRGKSKSFGSEREDPKQRGAAAMGMFKSWGSFRKNSS